MSLHRDEQAFRDLVTITAAARGMRQSFIEKDYWVTWVLRNLADSPVAEQVVFKGGTSLSKAYGLLERFSEDVDLAVIRHNTMFNKFESSCDSELHKNTLNK